MKENTEVKSKIFDRTKLQSQDEVDASNIRSTANIKVKPNDESKNSSKLF